MENKINYYSEDKEQFADVYIKKDLIFKCRVNGLNNSGSAVILLHGFPETSKMWSKLIQFLSDNNSRRLNSNDKIIKLSKTEDILTLRDIKTGLDDLINLLKDFKD